MSSSITINLHISLRLPGVVEIANMPPSSYWGITVATAKNSGVKFAGRTQAEMLDLVVRSAGEATKEAVADNQQRGLDSPGSRDGKLVVLKPGGELIDLKR
jgi:hypothetical protein